MPPPGQTAERGAFPHVPKPEAFDGFDKERAQQDPHSPPSGRAGHGNPRHVTERSLPLSSSATKMADDKSRLLARCVFQPHPTGANLMKLSTSLLLAVPAAPHSRRPRPRPGETRKRIAMDAVRYMQQNPGDQLCRCWVARPRPAYTVDQFAEQLGQGLMTWTISLTPTSAAPCGRLPDGPRWGLGAGASSSPRIGTSRTHTGP